MSSPAYSIIYSAVIHGSVSSGSPGDVLIPVSAGGSYVLATSAARGTRRATGIALKTYTPNTNAEIQQSGQVDAATAGLGAGTASWVRVSSAGRLERCVPDATDDVVGTVDADGTFHAAFGFLTPAMIANDRPYTVGPRGSGARYITDGVADQVELNQAISDVNAAGGGVVQVLAGTYYITNQVNLKSGVTLKGSGTGVTKFVVATAFATASCYYVVGAMGYEASGSITSPGVGVPLTADATMGSSTLTFAATLETASIVVGDFLFLQSEALWETTNLSGRKIGEYVEVLAISPTSITTSAVVRDNYLVTDSAQFFRIAFVTDVKVCDLEIYQQDPLDTRLNNPPPMIGFMKVMRGFIDNCYLHDHDGPAVTVHSSIDVDVGRNNMNRLTSHPEASRFGYANLIGGATDRILVHDNRIGKVRHAADAGPPKLPAGPATNNHGVARGVSITGNIVTGCYDAAMSTHSEADGWKFSSNHVSRCNMSAFNMRGRGNVIQGNTIEWCPEGINIGNPIYEAQGGSGAGSHVIGNSIRYMKALGGRIGQGINLLLTDKVIVEGNTISECDRAGIVISYGVTNSYIGDNRILDCNLANFNGDVSDAIVLASGFNGTNASLTYSAGIVTLTRASAGFSEMHVGRTITISNSTTPANNGVFTILTASAATPTVITYANASGANDASGTVVYGIEGSTDNVFENNFAMNNPASRFARGSVGLMQSLIRDYGIATANPRNTYRNNTGKGLTASAVNMIRTNSGTVYTGERNIDLTNKITFFSNEAYRRMELTFAPITTTDATVTTIASYHMNDETVAAFDVIVTAARQTNVTKAARYKRSVVYRRTGGGNGTIVGALETGTDEETDAAWDLTITASGADILVRATGAAATNINWTCDMSVQETLKT